MLVVLTGPSGCGKTTVGQALAAALSWRFVEADDLHSEAAREKMESGVPLSDADRAPWLARVASELAALGDRAVVACSALRRTYRDQLRAAAPDVRMFLLDAPRDVLASRLAARTGHFMPASLLDSQLATLERGDDVVVLDATRSLTELVTQLTHALHSP